MNTQQRPSWSYLSGRKALASGFTALSLMLSSTLIVADESMPKNWQSLEQIEQAAIIFLEEMQDSADKDSVKIAISPIDSRTRLNQCRSSIEAFLSPGMKAQGKTTVGVKCHDDNGWKIYLSARVTQYQWVWVASRNLETSDIIGNNDIEKREVSLDYVRKNPQLEKKRLLNTSPTRRISEGSVLFEDSVCLVCRGQPVKVTAESSFLKIDVEGIALMDATLGENAQVRNSQSKRVFDAIVIGKNQLSVAIAQSE